MGSPPGPFKNHLRYISFISHQSKAKNEYPLQVLHEVSNSFFDFTYLDTDLKNKRRFIHVIYMIRMVITTTTIRTTWSLKRLARWWRVPTWGVKFHFSEGYCGICSLKHVLVAKIFASLNHTFHHRLLSLSYPNSWVCGVIGWNEAVGPNKAQDRFISYTVRNLRKQWIEMMYMKEVGKECNVP